MAGIRSPWSIPLFLFVSPQNEDTALLPHAPHVQFGADYTKLLADPVAWVQPASGTTPPQHPLVGAMCHRG